MKYRRVMKNYKPAFYERGRVYLFAKELVKKYASECTVEIRNPGETPALHSEYGYHRICAAYCPDKTIILNGLIVDKAPSLSFWRDTIMHEIAHHRTPWWCCDHGLVWKFWAWRHGATPSAYVKRSTRFGLYLHDCIESHL